MSGGGIPTDLTKAFVALLMQEAGRKAEELSVTEEQVTTGMISFLEKALKIPHEPGHLDRSAILNTCLKKRVYEEVKCLVDKWFPSAESFQI
ncbi:MAG: hypothetical protein PVJ92_01025 [Candidatus Dependentiae bacterium]|jgi:hypothetical protein